MKTLLLLLFVSLLVIGAKAQNGFTTYTASLPDIPNLGNKQTSIVVDNANNVWMGYNATLASAGRLVKYNSTSQIYTVYSTTSTPSISNNRITCLTKDATGTIWIGTYGGVIKYDGVNFTTVGLGTTIINCIEAIGNQIYVGANTGLYRYDGISFTNYNVANGLLPNDNVKLIKAENANKLWIGNTTTQLVQFNIDNSFSVTSYSNVQLPIISGVISALYLDGQNNKWIAVLDNILNYNAYDLYLQM